MLPGGKSPPVAKTVKVPPEAQATELGAFEIETGVLWDMPIGEKLSVLAGEIA